MSRLVRHFAVVVAVLLGVGAGISSVGAQAPVDDRAGGDDAASDPQRFPDEPVGVTRSEVRIGFHAPETLAGVPIGDILGIRKIIEAFEKSTNEAGGIRGRDLDVVVVDDGYAVNSAVDACRELLQEDLLFVSGTSGADQIVTCGRVVLQRKVPYLSLGVSEPGLVDTPGYRALTMTYEQQSKLMAQYVVRDLDGKSKKIAMVRFDSPNADGARQQFKKTLKKLGVKLTVDDAVNKDGNANELSAECVKLQRAEIDIVYLLAAPTVSRGLANACEAQGYEPQYVSPANTVACDTEPPIYGPSLDGCIIFRITRVPDQVEDNPLAQEAKEAWAKYYPGDDEPSELITFWGALDVYREAIGEAGKSPTPRKFLSALDELDYDNGIFNPIRFDGSRILGHGVVVAQAHADPPGFTELVPTWATKF